METRTIPPPHRGIHVTGFIFLLALLQISNAALAVTEPKASTDSSQGLFPFELHLAKDVALATVGTAAFATGIYLKSRVEPVTEKEIAALEAEDINRLTEEESPGTGNDYRCRKKLSLQSFSM